MNIDEMLEMVQDLQEAVTRTANRMANSQTVSEVQRMAMVYNRCLATLLKKAERLDAAYGTQCLDTCIKVLKPGSEEMNAAVENLYRRLAHAEMCN